MDTDNPVRRDVYNEEARSSRMIGYYIYIYIYIVILFWRKYIYIYLYLTVFI